jgi:hypothetical protein
MYFIYLFLSSYGLQELCPTPNLCFPTTEEGITPIFVALVRRMVFSRFEPQSQMLLLNFSYEMVESIIQLAYVCCVVVFFF